MLALFAAQYTHNYYLGYNFFYGGVDHEDHTRKYTENFSDYSPLIKISFSIYFPVYMNMRILVHRWNHIVQGYLIFIVFMVQAAAVAILREEQPVLFMVQMMLWETREICAQEKPLSLTFSFFAPYPVFFVQFVKLYVSFWFLSFSLKQELFYHSQVLFSSIQQLKQYEVFLQTFYQLYLQGILSSSLDASSFQLVLF